MVFYSGSHLYVCAKGTIEVYKEGKKVNTLGPGKIFGELALLCNTRRNATIKGRIVISTNLETNYSSLPNRETFLPFLLTSAITPCTLWVLDRKIFNQIVKRVGTRRIEEHVRYLRSVPVLNGLDNDSLKKMTDLLKVVSKYSSSVHRQ